MLLAKHSNSLKQLSRNRDQVSVFLEDSLKLRTASSAILANKTVRNKIYWQSPKEYNKRWQFKWRHAYYTYPREGHEATRIKRPEELKDAVPIFGAWIHDAIYRGWPTLKCWWFRRHRMFDPFSVYLLPGTSLFFYQFTDLTFGFTVLSALPWFVLYTRIRDKTLDPDFKETFLRDMLYKNEKITKYFKEETIHVLDYEFEYDKGYPDAEKFPEYNNKVWRFMNTDTGMCSGHMKFGDVESGATMTLWIKTMPVPGRFRYQVGEPFFFYSLRAEIQHDGVLEEVVLVDENEVLKRTRPFLFLI
eukprot:TRINITY_DN754_c0_g2_i1.p1 TRINITY_DN754_c0_g2~~TRINITY_DN754_c0_g2_i1.p1  ORF type:complete len:303 (+),score=71.86 TRINITY_DN754_c0_g2_i1:151-1059(+)